MMISERVTGISHCRITLLQVIISTDRITAAAISWGALIIRHSYYMAGLDGHASTKIVAAMKFCSVEGKGN